MFDIGYAEEVETLRKRGLFPLSISHCNYRTLKLVKYFIVYKRTTIKVHLVRICLLQNRWTGNYSRKSNFSL